MKNILGVIPGLQATALLGPNIKLVTKKKTTSKDFIKAGITNFVGIGMTGATAKMINDL